MEHTRETRSHVNRDAEFSTQPFARMKGEGYFLRRDRVDIWLDDAYRSEAGFTRRAKVALLHRVAMLQEKKRSTTQQIYTKYAQNAQIYHTPHSTISPHLRSFKHLALFQTIYDMIPFLMPDKFTRTLLDFYQNQIASLQETDWIVADSHSAKNDFCEYSRFDPSRVFVTHLAADPAKFHRHLEEDAGRLVREKYGIPDGRPYILSVCTFEPRKNIEHVIRCFSKLVSQEPRMRDAVLVLAGKKGWQFDEILHEIERTTHAQNHIFVTGFVDDSDLAPLYSGALAFVYPSLYEGFGLPPLEAMQCGTPVITSNTSSLPEVVGDAGILLDPKDQDGLCQAMLDLYSKPELRAQMARKSLAQAAKFSWEKCAEQTIQAYKTALAVS